MFDRPYYQLDENNQIQRISFEEMLQSDNGVSTHVARTDVGGMVVSTIFLSTDHGWRPYNDEVTVYHPTLFETAMMGGIFTCFVSVRNKTYDEALKTHRIHIKLAQNIVTTLVKSRKARFAKRNIEHYDLQVLRQWYGSNSYQARKQLRNGGLVVEDCLKPLQGE